MWGLWVLSYRKPKITWGHEDWKTKNSFRSWWFPERMMCSELTLWDTEGGKCLTRKRCHRERLRQFPSTAIPPQFNIIMLSCSTRSSLITFCSAPDSIRADTGKLIMFTQMAACRVSLLSGEKLAVHTCISWTTGGFGLLNVKCSLR